MPDHSGRYEWLRNRDPAKLCQAKRKKGQCYNFCEPGSSYCRFHGGRRSHAKRVRLDKLPRFYARYLRGTLKELLDECAQEDPAEQVQLYEELALMRRAVLDTVLLYEACMNPLPDGRAISPETREMAAVSMRSALKDVEYMVSAVARLEALKKDKVSAYNLDYAASQLVRIAYDVFGDDEAKAREFQVKVRECLMVGRSDGTDLAPGDTAAEMDATVPSDPGDD